MKDVAGLFSIAGAVVAFVSGFYWVRAARVSVPLFGMRLDGPRPTEVASINRQACLNGVAAWLAGVAAFLQAIAALAQHFSN